MGLGDVKLLAMLAAWLGLRQTGLVLFLAVVAGALYGLGTILLHREMNPEFPVVVAMITSCSFPQNNGSHRPVAGSGQLPVPFGTMLSVAGLYSIFLGERTLGWYLKFFH